MPSTSAPRIKPAQRLAAAVLLCAAVAAHAQCPYTVNRASDKWVAEDKALHAGVSYVAGVVSKDLLYRRSDWAAFGLAMVPGLVKEWADSREPCNFWSWKDIAADALGALLGVKWRGWIVTPKTISYESSW